MIGRGNRILQAWSFRIASTSLAPLQQSRQRRNVTKRANVQAPLDNGTPREFDVMQHVIAGNLNKQIADELGAAEKTIKIHRGRVMEKMGVVSVAEHARVLGKHFALPTGLFIE